ncbi:hypothetical protein AB0H20_09375 [Nocardia fluminea]|uniref:hypothetical protein n=1 Tax=Nocardia fluminea TaxID=134984 RepID=UPI0033F72091
MQVWVPVIAAFVSVVGAVAIALYTHRQTRRDVRAMIKSDAEVLKLLKEINPNADGAAKLAGHIDWRIEQMTKFERGARRDWASIWTALLVWAVAIAGGIAAVAAGGWWRLFIAPAVLLFVVGLAGIPGFKKQVRET